MPPSAATDDETHVKYTTNSTSDRTIYDTMKDEGILYLHKDHLLAGALPDCMSSNVGNANQVGVSMHLLTFLSDPFFKFSFEALETHLLGAVQHCRGGLLHGKGRHRLVADLTEDAA